MEPLAAGTVLAGRYRLVRPLGSGGIAVVWAAEDTREERRLALKFPLGDADGSGPALLRAEYQAAKRLIHPGIVRVIECLDGPPPCLVMQHIDGADLGALRGAGFRDILAAADQVVEALEYAHRQGVVHRDLKPANVLRDAQGHCYVTDFGAGAFHRGGSLPGMSPQQLDGLPPAPGDDVYGLGALLYELLAGEPLFHPAVTPERIRAETAAIPLADLTGEALPAPLRSLLSAMLAKTPESRPASMSAVRAALKDVRQEAALPAARAADALIRPRARQAPLPAGAEPATPVPLPSRPGLPAAVVYGGMGVLLLAAIAVIAILPRVVRERGPLLGVTPHEEPRAAAAPDATAGTPAAAPVVPPELLDAALGDFLRVDDELRKAGAQKWGGSDWAELRRLAADGDAAYRDRNGARALQSYRTATTLGKGLLARAPELLAGSLRQGRAALAAGEQQQAVTAFETALAVAPDNAEARHGLERARKLDQVLGIMRQASAAEAAGQRDEALRLYRQAAAHDPAWQAAAAGIARLEQAAASDAYAAHMARGLAAQAGGHIDAARDAFAAALRVRPGDSAAVAALAQADADRKLGELAGLQAAARDAERAERWADAGRAWGEALALDANLLAAREGQAHAAARLELDQRLRRTIGNAEHFNEDAELNKARALLESARAMPDPGPVLAGQLAELQRLVTVAAMPVPVVLESDNLTEVTIFKVGRLGAFSTRTLQLRPGVYTAVGSREGYRDVRRNFRVPPDGSMPPVVVRCEEAI